MMSYSLIRYTHIIIKGLKISTLPPRSSIHLRVYSNRVSNKEAIHSDKIKDVK